MQAVVLAVFDGVVAVIEDTVEPFVQMRNVVAAVEVVVDVDFPVAVEGVLLARVEVKGFEIEGGYAFDQIAEEIMQRFWVGREVDEDEVFPGIDDDGDKAIVFTPKVADAGKLGHAFESAVEAVVPSVIRAMQKRGASAGLRHDGGRVVATNVVESPQHVVVAADNDYRFPCDSSADELAWRFHLIRVRDELPSLAKYVEAFQKLSNPVFQERVYDIKDVCRRILWHLRPIEPEAPETADRLILIAHEASVMDLFSVDFERLA